MHVLEALGMRQVIRNGKGLTQFLQGVGAIGGKHGQPPDLQHSLEFPEYNEGIRRPGERQIRPYELKTARSKGQGPEIPANQSRMPVGKPLAGTDKK